MSHFAVVVVTKEYPTEEVLNKALQPYHEYECTGIDDEFVVNVDITEDSLSEYKSHKKSMVRLPDGEMISYFDDRFYRDPTPDEVKKIGIMAGTGSGHGMSWTSRDWGDGKGYKTKIHFLPEFAEEIQVPCDNVMTFREFLVYWYGMEDKNFVMEGEEVDGLYNYAFIDDAGNVLKVFKKTNPNKKWDWWQVGGRYTGRFSSAYDPEKDERNLEWRYNPSIGADEFVPKWPTQWVKFEGDIIQKSVFNLEKIMSKKRVEVGLEFDRMISKIKDFNFRLWSEITEGGNYGDEQREEYNSQQAVIALREDWVEAPVMKYFRDKDREGYVNAVSSTWIAPYAFVHEGKWYQKGEMGWFGLSNDKIDQVSWHDQFTGMIDSLEPTDWITVVDCHI